jgi:methyltransferase (TIGR00027 family)
MDVMPDALSEVSETSLLTLKARADEARKSDPLITDPMAIQLFEGVFNRLPEKTRKWIGNLKLPSSLVNYIVLRTRQYDRYTREFLERNDNSMVVSLGCGFDTRYWRVSSKRWNYLELDLPEVVGIKNKVLGNAICYPMISASVLDPGWLDEVSSRQSQNILFLAEGLFMYLPGSRVQEVFKRLSESFSRSQLVFEAVQAKYTRGIWKKAVESKMKRRVGSSAGSAYQFGITNGRDVESFGRDIRLIDEWSYFEDPDVSPKILRLFRHFEFLSRTQWTVRVSLG